MNDYQRIFGRISPPDAVKDLGTGNVGLGNVLTNILTLIYILAGIAFLFMIVFAAFQLITSGGDKEKVGAARSRITYAVIGIIILALAFVAAQVLGSITGLTFF